MTFGMSVFAIFKRTTAVFLFTILYFFFVQQQYYLASPEQSGMSLKQVLGYDGNGRNNLVWKEG